MTSRPSLLALLSFTLLACGSGDSSAARTSGATCQADAECASGFCDPWSHWCTTRRVLYAGCEVDAQCAEATCLDTVYGRKLCTMACGSDADCGDALCVDATCVRPCTDSYSPYACIDGRPLACTAPAAQAASCDACGCPTDQECIGSKCQPKPPRQVLVTAPAAVQSPILLEDGNVYYTTSGPGAMYTTDTTYTISRVAKAGGGKQALHTITNTYAEMFGIDASAGYLRFWNDTQAGGNRWDANVDRLPLDGSPAQFLAGNWDVNVDPEKLGQTGTTLFLQNWFYKNDVNQLEVYDTPTQTRRTVQQVTGRVAASAVEGDTLQLVISVFGGKPSAYTLSSAGVLTQGRDLPNLCAAFARDTAHAQWIALCGASAPFDVVRIAGTSVAQTLGTAVASPSLAVGVGLMVSGSAVYWTETATLRSFDLTTEKTRTLRLDAADQPFALDDTSVYYTNDKQILRTPLSAASAP